MKVNFYGRFLSLLAFCMLLSVGGFSQNSAPSVSSTVKIENPKPAKKLKPKRIVPKTQAALAQVIEGVCDNDVVVPEIQCVGGYCLPDARAAYVTSANNGEPWGQYDNINAMETVFGYGNWDAFYFEYDDISALLTPSYKVLFLEGSYYSGYALQDFLAVHGAALESWVAAGGALFINCANIYGPYSIDFGFGGLQFQSEVSGYTGYVQAPGHPIFNGPYLPANGNFSGYYYSQFQYGSYSGNVGNILISDNGPSLIEHKWGLGKAYFGAILPPAFHSPQPNVLYMWVNLLVDLNNQCNAGLIVNADAGGCTATVLDPAYDATATDDCALASLTHDFAGAPSNTSLNGAVLPAGNTVVRWTATDASGNSSTCETLLSVREPELPVITCPNDLSVPVDLGTCGATVSFEVTATDNCATQPQIIANPPSGSSFPVGTTTVFASANDDSYNNSTCVFNVTVVPNPEICNGLDDDCNGWVDDGAMGETTFYRDYDYDGYGDPNNAITGTCPIPYGYVFNAFDCDDTNYYIQPGMYEYCNGIDDNCDGNIDEGVAPAWYLDADGDGYGDATQSILACEQPQGYANNGWDCVDTDAYIHPGALEDCTNLTDENCDGILGENNFVIEEIHNDVFCGSNPDGSISITVSPAQNYSLYLWSNHTCCTTELTNLDFGTYKVTVTNECGTSKTKSIQIEPSAEPALQVQFTGTDFICGGASDGTITAIPSDGCGGYTFEWNTGSTDASITGLSGGDYTVVVTDACGCTRSGTYTINQPEQLALYFNNVIPLLDGTYFVQVVPYGGTSPYQFRHSTATGFTDWGASNGFLNVLPGDYVFEVQDSKGCSAQAQILLDVIVPRPMDKPEGPTAPTEVEARATSETDLTPLMEQKWSVSLFPNPNTGSFKVDLRQAALSDMSFGITDQSGRLLLEKHLQDGIQVQDVNAENLPSGLYFLQVISDGKVVAVEMFVKE